MMSRDAILAAYAAGPEAVVQLVQTLQAAQAELRQQASGFLQDITDREEVERALRQAEHQLRTVIQTLPIVMFTLDQDGVFTLSEGRGLANLGLAPGQVVGQSALAVYEDTPAISAALRRALSGEPSAEVVHAASRAFDLRCDPLRDASGAVVGVMGVALDVTEREAASVALRESEQRFRALVENGMDAIALYAEDGTILYQSPAVTRILGYTPDELVGRNALELSHPEDTLRVVEVMGEVLTTPGVPGRLEVRTRHKDGSYRWLELVGTSFLNMPGVGAIVANYRDVTERRQAEEALRLSEERYVLAARGANDGLWDWDVRAGTAYFSPRWKAMLGLDENAPAGTLDAWLDRVHADDLDRLRLEIAAHVEGASPHIENEHRIRLRDGGYRWVLSRGLAVRNAAGKAERVAGSLTDITDHKRAEERLLHDALHDGLTGLPNRVLFLDRLGQALRASYRRESFHFGVVFLDLDGFKVVNDSLGHRTGDQLLSALAQRLRMQMRSADTLARLGGDEFVILLEDIATPAVATQTAERILELVSQPFELQGRAVVVSASVGVVWSGVGYERPEDILRDADIAMYRAKISGKARYEVFTPSMREVAMARLEVEADLRQALEREEFEVHYQPIVSLATGRLEGFEALVRWAHPRRGLIAPGGFIPLAEESGLIVPIDRWVLAAAGRQVRDWQLQFAAHRTLALNVNFSSRHFTQPDLASQIAEIVTAAGLPAGCLCLEITEGALMENMELAQRALHDLHALGVRVEIDDFGTGYSSLGYLAQLSVDTLKIDRSFVARLGPESSGGAIVSTIVNLAHNLNMTVIAEGVETEVQLAQLQAAGCEEGQGFLISRPLTAAAAADLIAHWDALRPALFPAPMAGTVRLP